MSLKTFQKNNGLTPDGILGLKTMTVFKNIFNLNNVQTAHFFGQIAHETGGFKYSSENLNYSSTGLQKIFKKYFPTPELANEYARKPEKIANKVYANRMGNGSEESGDGWKYRGRGAIQLTGFNNYKKFSEHIENSEVLTKPDIVADTYYLESALFFFKENGLFDILGDVEQTTVKKLTKRINGGYNGLDHRYKLTIKYYELLNRENNITDNKEETKLSDNRDTTNSNIVSLDKESNEPKETRSDKVRTEERSDKKGFFAKIIGWLLQKISGRHIRQEGVAQISC